MEAVGNAISRRKLLALISGLAVSLVLIVGYKVSPFLFPPAEVQVLPDSGCDLQRTGCPATLPGAKVDLEFLTRPIPLARPFRVSLTTVGVEPRRVELDFAGVEMDMGYNRTVLKSIGGGRYLADITLPVCITGQMKWRATLILHTRDQRLSIPYEFLTGEVH